MLSSCSGGHIEEARATLAISPSSALTYILGNVICGWGGDWAEKGLRLIPFDAWAFAAHHSIVLGHFKTGCFVDAARAAHKAVQVNPAHSISHMLLERTGKIDEARAAASTVLRLQPKFSCRRQFTGVDCEASLVEVIGSALRTIGLPE